MTRERWRLRRLRSGEWLATDPECPPPPAPSTCGGSALCDCAIYSTATEAAEYIGVMQLADDLDHLHRGDAP